MLHRTAALALLLSATAVRASEPRLWTEGKGTFAPTLDAKSFARVMKAAGPAIVSVFAAIKGRRSASGPDEPGRNVGSGFIIRRDGLAVTNQHVVGDGTDVRVRTSDGRTFAAAVIGWDRRTDLALLQILEGAGFPVVPLGDSDHLAIGEWVLAIGNPLALEQSLTVGVVSAKGRRDLPVEDIPYQDFIQTDASINPGNSGGPLLNLRGEVIGILTAVNRAGQGIAFATPINMARTLIPTLYREGRVTRSWLGINIDPQDVSAELARAFELSRRAGAIVNAVVKESPAERAGFLPGDVIVRFDGQPIRRASELSWLVSLAGIRDAVDVVIVRGGIRKRLNPTLIAQPVEMDPPPPGAPRPAPVGMEVSEVAGGPQDSDSHGGRVRVTGVIAGSAADRAGVHTGDTILELNGVTIRTIDDYFEVLRRIAPGEILKLRIIRDGAARWLAFSKGSWKKKE